MKLAIILCTLFALTFAAVRRVPVPVEELTENVEFRPNRISIPSENVKTVSNKIIGGNNDNKGDHPYQASLQRLPNIGNWYHTCGGSIISPRRILTAAHCIDSGAPASAYRVIVGEYDLPTVEGTEQTIAVSELVIHPQWNRPKINYDVAVLRLSKDIKYDLYAQPVVLAETTPPDGTVSTVTGWGWTDVASQTRPRILQVYTTEREGDYWANLDTNLYDAVTQVATSDPVQGNCFGDSGGPLIENQNRKQYGVVSYGRTPCGSVSTDYYARVSYFRMWILAQ